MSKNNCIDQVDNGQRKNDFNFACFVQRKIYRANENLKFLKNCKTEHILPSFTKINRKVLREVNWSPKTIYSKRLEKLNQAILSEESRLRKNYKKLHIFLDNITLTVSQKDNLIYSSKTFISQTEVKNDKKRIMKYNKLKSSKVPRKLETINIHNFSDTTIPDYVIDILKLGADSGIGGTQNNIKLLREMEKLINHWVGYAEVLKIDPITVFETKNFVTNLFFH